MPPTSARALAFLLVTVAACDRPSTTPSDDNAPGGSLVAAMQTEIGVVIPPVIRQVDEKLVADQIFEPLAWIGDDSRTDADFRPALADSWSWESDSLAIVFHLNPRARWHDGEPVRASDVRFTHSLYADPAVGSQDRSALAGIDSVTVRDSSTAVFWFGKRYPDQLYDAAIRMLILPEHVLSSQDRATLATSPFGRNPIGSGRFRLAKWDANSIELVADTNHYRGRAKLDRVIFAPVGDPNTLVTRMTGGEIDAAEIANADQFRSLSKHPDFNSRILPAFDYAFLHFNLQDPSRRGRPNPLFADRELRRALTMALDRDRLVASQFDTLGTVALGPMTHAQPLADTTAAPIPYDSAGAARLLDSLGWKLPVGKRVRERDGRPLSFTVMVPTVSKNRMAMVVRLQQAYGAAGVKMDIEAIDPGTFMARLAKRDYHAAFDGTRAELSVSGLRPYWTVAGARNAGGQNSGNYENPMFDVHLDSALAAPEIGDARAHASKAFATIIADAPAVWLYETRTAPVIHKRFRTAHVIPTAWWLGISEWSIPASERIPRDRIGLKVASR
jgi:peptide/nickel transport system substrate-binding protein